ncbi:hypothetical protein BJL95_05540 [Methylomonas sp. LWB]|uniref:restriction endonuclease subunit S n=1 Tax=Methylomonas sp. LWB TaxID=1905845 RepID=UPI0008D9F250|nr:restriction endonuclease subunit S [Methylomonas sp. LWB]OHX37486.1 hypothetical protein BJL95_05540 [Methylomonas sp. LWB]
MTDLINQHLDIWTSAIASKASIGRGNKSPSPAGEGRGEGNSTNSRNTKYTAYGIKKLRELILELAVRGKLVPQDPTDEHAGELLKRIQSEKDYLTAKGRTKNKKPLSEVSNKDKQTQIPAGWILARVGSLFNVVYGKGLSNSELTDDGFDVFGANGIIGKYKEYLYQEPQLLISCRGAYSGKPNISPKLCFITSNSLVLENSWKNLSLKFIYYALTIADKEKIVTGSAQPQVTTTNLDPFPILIPPLAEQHRIVAKVDELMALCDQLEQQQTDHLAAHQTLVQTLLDTLTQTVDAAEFEQAWGRIADHFDTLFTTESSIDQLKQTLLQLAVMGKLVPQDSNDEPANVLLDKIVSQKARLSEDGIIKKQKALPKISEKEKPFEIPTGWAWARWDDFTEWMTYGFTRPMPHVESGPIIITAKNVQYGYIDIKDVDYTSKDAYADLNLKDKPKIGDILITKDGSIGRAAVVNLDQEFCINQSVAVLWLRYCPFNREFLVNAIHSGYLQNLIWEAAAGAAIKHISITKFVQFPIAIPPLNEQHRIVVKVDELMTLCDALKARIAAAQTTQLQLADAIVEQAVA